MSLRLVNRHGLLSLPILFFMNIFVVVASVFLWQLNEWIAVGFAWLYLFYMLVQTRLILILCVFGLVGGVIASGFTSEFSQYQVLYAIGVLFVSSVVAHGVAYIITALTGI